MKQHLTSRQLSELSDKGKDRLEDWAKNKNYLGINFDNGCQWFKALENGLVEIHRLPYLSIGQMLELIRELDYESGWALEAFFMHKDKEPAEVLWEKVKEILEA